MENFKKFGNEIVDYINDPFRRIDELLTMEPARFVLCGVSGSGKTRAIEYANMKLPLNNQVAESHELLFINDVSMALDIFKDNSLAYTGSRHIGFNIVRKEIAEMLEKEGEKVFWFGRSRNASHPVIPPESNRG